MINMRIIIIFFHHHHVIIITLINIINSTQYTSTSTNKTHSSYSMIYLIVGELCEYTDHVRIAIGYRERVGPKHL